MSDRDFTKQCLRDVQEKVAEFQLKDLRHMCCADCRNMECQQALLAGNPWEERMATQVDRLLDNPVFADIQDPKWAHLRQMDLPDLFRESLRLHISEKRGDWSLPTKQEVDAAVGVLPGQSEAEPSNPDVDRAVEAMQRLHTVIQIDSQTQPGVVYEVTVDAEGQALLCTCLAGKYGRRCSHRSWAEQEFQKRQRPNPPEKRVEDTQQASVEGEAENPLPMLGVRREPSGGRQAPLQGLARNTALLSQGVLLEGAPADGLRKVARDPWAPSTSSRQSITPSGVHVTIGKKND